MVLACGGERVLVLQRRAPGSRRGWQALAIMRFVAGAITVLPDQYGMRTRLALLQARLHADR